jgi:hypothetical protein
MILHSVALHMLRLPAKSRGHLMPRLHITSTDKPYPTVKRRLGIMNAGLYCDKCPEFFAIAIFPPEHSKPDLEFISDGPLLFVCPFCQQTQSRQASDIVQLTLRESTRRKPQTPPPRQ